MGSNPPLWRCTSKLTEKLLERQLLEQSFWKWPNLEQPCDKLHKQDFKKCEAWLLYNQSGCCAAVSELRTYPGRDQVFFLWHRIVPMWRGPVLGGPKNDKSSTRVPLGTHSTVDFDHAGQKIRSTNRWVCVFIDAKMTTVKENWTSPVQSVLYLQCTRLVWFSLTVVVLASIKTQIYTCFFSVHVEFVPQPTQNLIKKRLTDGHLSRNWRFWTT